MGRRKALSAGPKLQSRGANRSAAATIASEAEVSLPDRRGRVLPALPLRPPSAHRSLSSSPLPAALLAFPFTAQSRERTPHTPARHSPDGQHGRALPYREGQPAARAAAPLLLRPARLCIFKPRCSIPLRPITARADPDGEWQPSPRFFKPSLSTNRRPAPLAPPPRSPHPNRFQRV